ncbi:acyltransferase family protein [Lichenifustis flavocetrariae]|uniref:Acyltransferase n=1 Tax=Lichenifustis flavocetrariae TaxID=2949735 RepID=A0AA41YT60_9HYPH|nr:acyltransferase [Lichenifustis flavocetrariae]MCW6508121.1 acyltransferase [Lichenifustis flavocetrariae]
MSLAATTTDLAATTLRERAEPAVSTVRIPELDGLRGLMTIFVVVSHYFGEVPHGIGPLCVGWVAVNVFFVLSGYLVGRLIIEKKAAANFLPVFYIRRLCRTVPTYLLCCALVLLGIAALGQTSWARGGDPLPAWTYFAFVQNVYFIVESSTGVRWLSPTWTLALEEQFYLVAPLVFLVLPRRFWLPALGLLAGLGFAGRAYGITHGLVAYAPLALLPTSGDVLCMGLLLAVLVKEERIAWARWSLPLRVLPIVLLFATFGVQRLDAEPGGPWFQVFGPLLMAGASAAFILMLVKGAPEAQRFKSPLLRFFGEISYSVYLTHLAVLGLLHGCFFGREPQLGSVSTVAATLLAIPATIAIAWLLTSLVERPLTAWGRGFRWREDSPPA